MSEIVNIKDSNKKVTKNTKNKRQPLSALSIQNEVEKSKKKKEVVLNINGNEYSYHIDTNALSNKKIEFINEIKNTTLVIYTSEELKEFREDEDIEAITQGFMVAAILKVFSDLEVPTPIIERANFMNQLVDLGILDKIIEEIPKELESCLEEASEELAKIESELRESLESNMQDTKKEVDNIYKDINDLSSKFGE